MPIRTKNAGNQTVTDLASNTLRTNGSTSANVTTSTANATVTLGFATVAGYQLSPGKIEISFDAAPATTCSLSVTDFAGTSTYWTSRFGDIGPHQFDLNDLLLPISTGMKVTVNQGGANVKSILNVRPHTD